MIVSKYGNRYEDFKVGSVIEHALSKTILESDNNLFSLLTMNHHPVHLNSVYANIENEGILVVGTLVLSLAVGITVQDISGLAIANLGYNNVRHLFPVRIGDTISVATEVLNKRLSTSDSSRGIVHVKSTVRNQNNVEVLEFERNVLLKTRNDE
jgi:acyl dehydratase